MEKLAWLLDQSIPLGKRWRIGLDAVLGLLPGIGDVTGTTLSAIIIARASMAGVPRVTLMRMVANVAIDSLLGAIPILGDIFDAAYYSNVRNMRLYREAMQGPRSTKRDWVFLIAVFLILGALAAIPVLVLLAVIRSLAA
jgi:hypothetical protein